MCTHLPSVTERFARAKKGEEIASDVHDVSMLSEPGGGGRTSRQRPLILVE